MNAFTAHCTEGRHCTLCRESGTAGQAWRAAAVRKFHLAEPMWPCPRGLPREQGDPPVLSLAAQRKAACDACDVTVEQCPLKRLRRQRPCRWRACLNRPGAVCLGADPPRWGPSAQAASP